MDDDLASLPARLDAGGVDAKAVIELDPPVDVVALADAWGIEHPVGVSGDVHQRRWHLMVAGAELPDPHGRRIAADFPAAGGLRIRATLTARPTGPLPDVRAGAAPAYDLRATGGLVKTVEILRM